ncbi:MAG: acyl-CoA thioesterase [Candidatus Marinimicrobia bacterium]|nr:acyl-CoA thioesterase [Candidatus Neomarinimicrobiota bacterium]
MKTWISTLTVRSYELDSFGHVNNGTFAKYLEKARGDYLIEAGVHLDDFHKWEKYPVIAKVCIEYRSPAFFNDKLTINAQVSRLGMSSLTLKYKIIKTDNTLCATAETIMVFVDKKGKSTPMPKIMREAFGEKERT